MPLLKIFMSQVFGALIYNLTIDQVLKANLVKDDDVARIILGVVLSVLCFAIQLYADNTEDGKNEDSIEVEADKQNSRPDETTSSRKNMKTLVKEEVTEEAKTADEPELPTKLSTSIKTETVAKSELLSNMDEIKSATTAEIGKIENSLKEHTVEKVESSEMNTTENHSEEYTDEIAEETFFNKSSSNIDENTNISKISLMNGFPEPEVAESFIDNHGAPSVNETSQVENMSKQSMVEEEAKADAAEISLRNGLPEQEVAESFIDNHGAPSVNETSQVENISKQSMVEEEAKTDAAEISLMNGFPEPEVAESFTDNHDAPSINETSKDENISNQSIVEEEAKTVFAEREEYPAEVDEMQKSSNFKLDEVSQIQSEELVNKIDVPNQNQEARTDVAEREDYPGEVDEMQPSSSSKLDKVSQVQSEELVHEADVPNQNQVNTFENTNGTIASAEELLTESGNVTTSTINEVVNDGTISTEGPEIITNSIENTDETINKYDEITANELNLDSSTVETEPWESLTTKQPSSTKCIKEDNASIVLERPKKIKAELAEDIHAYHLAVDVTFIYACY